MNHYRIVTSLLWLTALVLVAWTLLQMPLGAIVDTVAKLTVSQWLLFIALNTSVLLALTQRWRGLINMQRQQVSLSEIFLIRQAGQCISFITPGPQFGGEPFQLYWVWKRCSVPMHQGFLALALDRFMELWINFAVLLMAACYLFVNATEAVAAVPWLRVGLAAVLPLAGLSILLWIVLRKPGALTGALRRITARWAQSPRLSRLGDIGAGQWQAMQSSWQDTGRQRSQQQRTALIETAGLTLLTWVAVLAELWLLLSFVGVQPDVNAFVLIFVTIRMAMLLPLPAGIGTIEAGVLWTFHTLGLDVSAAVGLIALMRLRDVAILLLGVLCLQRVRGAVTGQSSGPCSALPSKIPSAATAPVDDNIRNFPDSR